MPLQTSEVPRTFGAPGRPASFQWRPFRFAELRRLVLRSDWAVGLNCLVFDLVLWLGVFEVCTLLHERISADGIGYQPVTCFVQFAVVALCLQIVGGYDRRTHFLSLNYFSEHCLTLLTAAALGGLVLYVGFAFSVIAHVSSSVLVVSQAAFASLSLVGRRALWGMMQAQSERSYHLVLGRGETARHLHRANATASHPLWLRYVDPRLSGAAEATLFTDEKSADELPPVESFTFGQFAVLLDGSAGVVIAEDHRQLSPDLMEWLSRLHYEHVPVYTLETFYARHWRRVPVYAIDATWPLQLEAQLASSSVYAHGKRLMDVAAAGLALALLAPVFLTLILLVALESGWPAFFQQTRIGRDRTPFTVYKFRTMYNRPAGEEGSLYTAANDKRITPLGKWLRKLRLDELPQLWNVLRGDMSLIGPRAEWDQLVNNYEASIPFYHFRHLVKPGITGWAQVNYPYGGSREDAVQKLKYDLYYIRNYSLRLDAMIVFKTFHTMLWGKGQ